jgi:hypothetical protein
MRCDDLLLPFVAVKLEVPSVFTAARAQRPTPRRDGRLLTDPMVGANDSESTSARDARSSVRDSVDKQREPIPVRLVAHRRATTALNI